MTRIIVAVLVISLILGVVFWKVAPNFGNGSKDNQPITLTVWGLWSQDYLKDVVDIYQKNNPKITINYKQQSLTNYRTRVQTQISNNQGPDIFILHNSWTGMFLKTNSLYPAPSEVLSLSDFQKTFYPVAKDNLTSGNNIYAMPLEVDGLAMYYNEDILNAAGVAVPSDWFSFIDASSKVTVKDQSGNIKTSGAALGSTNNVEYSSDILGLLFSQQPGADLEHPDSDAGAQVLKFYTSFITDPEHKTWDVSMESDTQAFEEGKLAFYFAPASKINDIRIANPNLHFKIAPVPQLPANQKVAWATFWALGVASNSQHPTEAWQFLKYLTSQETEKYLFQQQLKQNLYGEPYSRSDLASELAQDPIMGAFVSQGPYYKGWYLSSGTEDNGVNEEIIKAYSDTVDAILQSNTDPRTALQNTTPAVQQSLDKYIRPNPAPSKK